MVPTPSQAEPLLQEVRRHRQHQRRVGRHLLPFRQPVGITTQDPELMKRLDIDSGAERVANWFAARFSVG
jgi:hypothetical protein